MQLMKVTKSLIQKYQSGQCSSEERQCIQEWLENEEWPEESSKEAPGEEYMPIVWEIEEPKRSIRKWVLPFTVAASISMVLGFLGYLYLNHKPSAMPLASLATKQIHYKTDRTKRSIIQLGDGTTVTLNAASELIAPEQFTDSNRVVQLQGEAYFEVAKDQDRPFIILSEHGEIKVLGTEFNFKAYPAENLELDVKEGKVAFSVRHVKNTAQIVRAGERAVLQARSQKIELEPKLSSLNLLWKDGSIGFDDLSLQEIAKTIERKFDYQVLIKNKQLARQHFSGQFKDLHLNNLLDEIAFVLGCHYKIEERQITFY